MIALESPPLPVGGDLGFPTWIIGPVSAFPQFEYTMREVRRAGEALKGELIWTDETAEDIRQVFHIANNYRDSHAYPMRRLRYELQGQIQQKRITGGVTAARLKRMPSIRRKLRALSSHLNQIQDLAGCRAVVPDMAEVRLLVAAMQERSSHDLIREDDYIVRPKPDGYRSHHMVFKFRGIGDEAVYNDRRVEIQIRTALQHSWATAVEAVGLFRKEDMKAGKGNPDWLKLFRFMSAEFMIEEGCANTDSEAGDERRAALVELNKRLHALETLEKLRTAVQSTNLYKFDPLNKPDYLLIKYDKASNMVSVDAQYTPIGAVESYDRSEGDDSNGDFNMVLVEVDDIEHLKAAYPNYFGDVARFRDKLTEYVGAKKQGFTLQPQPKVTQRRWERPDMSWLRAYKRWK